MKDKTYGQFSDNYFNRLARLRPVLLEVAKREFPNTRGERSLRLPFTTGLCSCASLCMHTKCCPAWRPANLSHRWTGASKYACCQSTNLQ